MIVVDTNIVAYCWLAGKFTPLAEAVKSKAPSWHAPILWRSELRSILTGYARRGMLTWDQAAIIMTEAEKDMRDSEHLVDSNAVFDLVSRSGCSAYDCEFVALARALDIPLVTADRQILAAFPETAQSLEQFA